MVSKMNAHLLLLLLLACTFALAIVSTITLSKKRHKIKPVPNLVNTSNVPDGFSLVCESGSRYGTIFPLKKKEIKVGRSPDNHICIEDRYVSRHHALIKYSPSSYFEIVDLDSANGVWVNGKRVYHHILSNGDVLQIGGSTFRFLGNYFAPRHERQISVQSERVSAASIFRIEDYILTAIPGGKGGQARVYKAVPRRGGVPMAVKVFPNPDPYTLQKFQQVVRRIMNLNHAHIVKIFGYGTLSDTSLYLVMEYLPGGSLRDRLNERPVSVYEAVRITGEICEALEYAHKKGIIHRDIKPENILFDEHGSAKLIDFSAAHFSSERTITKDGILIGTPYYMSYEQAKGEKVTPASDIYSLGVVLFEMLTGQRPFEGDIFSVIDQHIRSAPPDPKRINANIPVTISQAVRKALEKDTRRRFKSAREFSQAIGYTRRTK